MLSDNMISYCPYPTPRHEQEEALAKLELILNNTSSFTLLYAPTGAGKSGIARAITDYFADKNYQSFIATKTKELQTQYLEESRKYNKLYLHFEKIVGRGNFKCMNLSSPCLTVGCDNGLCVHLDPFKALREEDDETLELFRVDNDYCFNHCSYRRALQRFRTCDVGFVNYHVLLYDRLYSHNYSRRHVLVCDEAHNLIDVLRDFSRLTLNLGTIKDKLSYEVEDKKYSFNIEKIATDLNTPSEWISFVYELVSFFKETYKFEIMQNFYYNVKEYSVVLNEIERYLENLKRKINLIQKDFHNFIFETHKNSCVFTPIRISEETSNLIFNQADHVVLMSASFTNLKLYQELLNIHDPYIIQISDNRPLKQNNPIYYHNVGRMNSKERKETLPRLCKEIEHIIRNKESKGLIHVPDYKTGAYIHDYFKNTKYAPRFLFHKNSHEKQSIVQEFKNSQEPLILISPTCYEGVDFPGDECRFQILTCLPVPFFDTFMRNLFKQRPLEVRMMIATKILQMLGRGYRSKEDYCENHLLDKRFTYCTYGNRLIKPGDFPEIVKDCFKNKNIWKYYSFSTKS